MRRRIFDVYVLWVLPILLCLVLIWAIVRVVQG